MTDLCIRVIKQLKDPLVKLFCHFVLYALNKFSTALRNNLQTHVNKIGTLQHDVFLQAFLSNFTDPDVQMI